MMSDQFRFFERSHLSARGSFFGWKTLLKMEGALRLARLSTSHRKAAS